jgi:hypothetical protein
VAIFFLLKTLQRTARLAWRGVPLGSVPAAMSQLFLRRLSLHSDSALVCRRLGSAGPAAGRREPDGAGVGVVGLRELPHPQRRQRPPRGAVSGGRPAHRRHPRAPVHHRLRRHAPAHAFGTGGARRHRGLHLPRPTQLRNRPATPSPIPFRLLQLCDFCYGFPKPLAVCVGLVVFVIYIF